MTQTNQNQSSHNSVLSIWKQTCLRVFRYFQHNKKGKPLKTFGLQIGLLYEWHWSECFPDREYLPTMTCSQSSDGIPRVKFHTEKYNSRMADTTDADLYKRICRETQEGNLLSTASRNKVYWVRPSRMKDRSEMPFDGLLMIAKQMDEKWVKQELVDKAIITQEEFDCEPYDHPDFVISENLSTMQGRNDFKKRFMTFMEYESRKRKFESKYGHDRTLFDILYPLC